MTALEQLAELTGEFQRIALSATVTPLDAVARYFGGYTPSGQPRRVQTVNVASAKAIDLQIKFPATAHAAAERGEKSGNRCAMTFASALRKTAQHYCLLTAAA